MNVSDIDVVVWTESEEREAWWRDIVGVATASAPAMAATKNREPSAVQRSEHVSARVLHAA